MQKTLKTVSPTGVLYTYALVSENFHGQRNVYVIWVLFRTVATLQV